MFNYLCESGRCHAIPSIAPFAISAVANVAVLMSAAVATRPPAPTAAPEESIREVVYLLPPPPQRTPFESVRVEWAGGDGPGVGPVKTDSASLLAGGGGEGGKGVGLRGARERERPPVDSAALIGDVDGSTFYVASELDRPVAFDPTSAGPVYPPELQRAGIEGWATLRFVVDSTGVADLASVKEVDVTHPGFAVAVREALPNMHFRPAELGERRVAQLVEQQFKFVIQRTAVVPPTADSLPPR